MGWVVRDESDRAYRVEGTLQLGRGHLATHDVHCSRRQALLTARHDALVIQAMGMNPLGIRSSATAGAVLLLGQTECIELQAGDAFFLCGKSYRFNVESDHSSAPSSSSSTSAAEPVSRKRPASPEPLDRLRHLEDQTSVVKRPRLDALDNGASSSTAPPAPPEKPPQQDALSAMMSASVSTPVPVRWQTLESSVEVGEFGPRVASAVWATFDLDGTLVVPASGRKFSKDAKDWRFLFPQVPTRLKELHLLGQKIVIFSNQKATASNDIRVVRQKVEAIVAKLGGIPVLFLAAMADDRFRKPQIGMWELAVERFSGGARPDPSRSYFVGDAAGRPDNWVLGHKHDHSDSDRKFALNCGLPFLVPEQCFAGRSTPPLPALTFDPHALLDARTLFLPSSTPLIAPNGASELIVLVGPPAAGKSSFVRKHLVPAGYVPVNQDTLKSRERCVALARATLESGGRAAIDNTNANVETRSHYVALARLHRVPIRCFWFQASEHQARHMNVYREMMTRGGTAKLPELAYTGYRSRFQEPTAAEGFDEVKRIFFVPDFTSDDDKKLFLRHLI